MRTILPLLTFFVLFWIVFSIFQHPSSLPKVPGQISQNHIGFNKFKFSYEPYTSINDTNILAYDAAWYNVIRIHNYYVHPSGDFVFAFFPLFPYIWKLVHLPPSKVPFLNFFLFIAGIWLLRRSFDNITLTKYDWIMAAFPAAICFLVPYSEAVFFATACIAVYGYTKNKYWIWFLGILLLSMTRGVSIILFFSFLFTELVTFLSERNLKARTISLMKNILPTIAGTFIVSMIQLANGSGSIFKFIDAHRHWNQTFSIPTEIFDWSWEGYGMNVASIYAVGFPLIVFSIMNIFRLYKTQNYLHLLSAFFLGGTTLFIYFFQNGNLHSTFRYILASPFLFILIYSIDVKNFSLSKRVFFSILILLNATFMFTLAKYSPGYTYEDLGFLLVFLFLGLWLFSDFSRSTVFRIVLVISIIANVIWTTFLFNLFLNERILFL